MTKEDEPKQDGKEPEPLSDFMRHIVFGTDVLPAGVPVPVSERLTPEEAEQRRNGVFLDDEL